MPDTWTIRGRAYEPAPFFAEGQGKQDGTACYANAVIWGIVNVTPDSFYDGGRHSDFPTALAHAQQLLADGAAILDLGGASSRPGSEDVPALEELKRVLPLLEALLAGRTDGDNPAPLISVDTWRADVARGVLEAGADIINDISACLWEPELMDIVAEYKPGYVLMHSRGRPQTMQQQPYYDDILGDVLKFFEERMNCLVQSGFPESGIILDPGIGFGKNRGHNIALLEALDKIQALGRPVLLGISNKSLFGDMFGLPKEERTEITNVCTALAAVKGIRHHRVHDVAGARQALALAGAMFAEA